MKKLLATLLFSLACATGAQAAGGGIAWDKFPQDRATDVAALQNGAKLFANYCLNCHSAAYMRYNRLRDIGLSEEQVKDNLLFAGEKVGETMKVAMPKAEAKAWFGAPPPDLSVEARARTADWLYTYLRGFYRDDTRPTGWNNTVYDKVAMPHVLWELQGLQQAVYDGESDAEHNTVHKKFKGFELAKQGSLSPQEYDQFVRDTVNFLDYIAEPMQLERRNLGMRVLAFLIVFFLFAYFLKKEFWKDVK